MSNQEGSHFLFFLATWIKHVFSLVCLFFLILIAFNQNVHQFLLEYGHKNFGNSSDFNYQAIKAKPLQPSCDLSLPIEALVVQEITLKQSEVLSNLNNIYATSADDPSGNHNSFLEQKEFTATLDESLTGAYDEKKIREQITAEREFCKANFEGYKKHILFRTSSFQSFSQLEEGVLSFVKLDFDKKLQAMLVIVTLVSILTLIAIQSGQPVNVFKSVVHAKIYWSGLTVSGLMSLSVSVLIVYNQYNLNGSFNQIDLFLVVFFVFLVALSVAQILNSKITIQEGSMASKSPTLPSLLIHALVTCLYAVFGASSFANATERIKFATEQRFRVDTSNGQYLLVEESLTNSKVESTPNLALDTTIEINSSDTGVVDIQSPSILSGQSSISSSTEVADPLVIAANQSSTASLGGDIQAGVSQANRSTGSQSATNIAAINTNSVNSRDNTSTKNHSKSVRDATNSSTVDQFNQSLVLEESPVEILVNWSAAWSAQDVKGYLSFYSKNFKPSNGVPREIWEQQRYERIGSREVIEVSLENISVERTNDAVVKVYFDQFYRSDNYTDQSKKMVELKREDGRWRILAEESM